MVYQLTTQVSEFKQHQQQPQYYKSNKYIDNRGRRWNNSSHVLGQSVAVVVDMNYVVDGMNSVEVGMNSVVVGMNYVVVGMNSVPVAHVNCCCIIYLLSNRLQDILGKGLEKGLVDNQDMNSMLHAMLWKGLRQELKNNSGHKHDMIKDVVTSSSSRCLAL
jgi:hypothetical protein